MQVFIVPTLIRFNRYRNRKKQGLQVTKFSNTHIVGDVSITDDSNPMVIIFYSIQDGWKAKVDGSLSQKPKKHGMHSSF